MTIATKEVVLDERRRTSLARVGRKDHDKYLVEEFDDGSVLLVPAVTISRDELEMLRNPAVVAALEESAYGDRSQLRRRPSPRRKPRLDQ